MAIAEKLSITLPPSMVALIKSHVETGAYASSSEVIREAMRLWQRREEEYRERLDVIRQRLDRSVKSGAPSDLDVVFDRVERKLEHQIKGAR